MLTVSEVYNSLFFISISIKQWTKGIHFNGCWSIYRKWRSLY